MGKTPPKPPKSKETSKEKQRRRVKVAPLGKSVVASFKDGMPSHLEIRDLPKVREMLGDEWLIAFIQGFNASERMDTFLHLLFLNQDLPKGSAALERNHRTLIFVLFGALHECMETLEAFQRTGIKGHVGAENQAWRTLDAMRKRWKKDPLLGSIRNKLAYHMGDPKEIEAGMDKFPHGRRLVIFAADGPKRFDNRHPCVMEILFAGLGLELDAFAKFVEQAQRDHVAFSRELQRLFCDLLRMEGVNFIEG